MTNWWVSTKSFTCWFQTNQDGLIVDTAPYLHRWRWKPMRDFIVTLRCYRIVMLVDK